LLDKGLANSTVKAMPTKPESRGSRIDDFIVQLLPFGVGLFGCGKSHLEK